LTVRENLAYPTLDEDPGRHRRNLDRSPVVAWGFACGAMARLID
jgi:hypothetical protein